MCYVPMCHVPMCHIDFLEFLFADSQTKAAVLHTSRYIDVKYMGGGVAGGMSVSVFRFSVFVYMSESKFCIT